MSILLTSSKKKDKKTSGRKSSSSSISSSGSGPPVSNSMTSVWYWNLNGVLTTVMYSRDSCEVWCNGFTLESRVRCDAAYGYMTEFTIYLDDRGSTHRGQLLRDYNGTPVLYVDGSQIQEHSG